MEYDENIWFFAKALSSPQCLSFIFYVPAFLFIKVEIISHMEIPYFLLNVSFFATAIIIKHKKKLKEMSV